MADRTLLLLLVPILAKTLLALVRRYFMAFTFTAAGHIILLITGYLVNKRARQAKYIIFWVTCNGWLDTRFSI